MKVLIVGAGISGLALASALHRDGAHVTVLEQAPEFTEAGSGLSMFGNGFRALDALGLGDAVREIAADAPPPGRSGTRRPDGRWMTVFTPGVTEQLRIVDRTDLHRVLVAACDGIDIRHGVRVDSADDTGVRVADGTRIGGFDVVVGADGLRSRVRSAWPAAAAPHHAGYGAWRGITTRAVSVSDGGETVGAGQRFGIAPLRDGRVYWFACLSVPFDARPGLDVLRSTFGSWHDPIPELIATTDDARISYLPIEYLRGRLDSYALGGRVLIGDAAHAMTPDLGQGANQGLEDAAVLARCLRPIITAPTAGAVADALADYDAVRRPRSRRIARQARLLGRVMQTSGPLASLRDAAMTIAPSRIVSATSARMQDWTPQA
ncbi:FAD-dependent oxidoreductase [Gordonia humi]|nr:FAD-dependent monooxygenase [Gordonia humi]